MRYFGRKITLFYSINDTFWQKKSHFVYIYATFMNRYANCLDKPT